MSPVEVIEPIVPIHIPVLQEEKSKPIVHEIDEMEKRKITASKDFQTFFSQSSKVFQRQIDIPYDVTIDYSKQSDKS